MSFHAFLVCDAAHPVRGRCGNEHSPEGRLAVTVRRRLRRQGWRRTRDGRDICPSCWQDGRR